MDSIIKQLNEVYFKEEWWCETKLNELEISRYHSEMIRHGRLLTYVEEGELLGYVESWRLNFEQFGRIICHVPFAAIEEEIFGGPIAYLANVWIRKSKRRGKVIKTLKFMFFEQNIDADYFVGQAKRKKTQPVKVFKRSEFCKKIFKEEEI